MFKRIQFITLFIILGLLLTAKAGLGIWRTTTDNFRQTTDAQTASAQPSLADVAVRPEQDKVSPHATAPISTNDSWTMLEAYLIPDAGAAASPHNRGSVLEDKTLTSLRQYKKKLDQRSQQLDQRSQALKQAEDKLKQRITELEQLEASIQQRLSDESKVKNKKIKRLTAVYEGMKPERAAPVIAKMELATVVKIFLLMDEKKVGKILSFLPPDKAVSISQALTRQISTIQ